MTVNLRDKSPFHNIKQTPLKIHKEAAKDIAYGKTDNFPAVQPSDF